MKRLSSSTIRPKRGFAHVAHIFLTALLPVVLLVFIRMGFPLLAVALLLLSKWRMFAVRARYWYSNLLANAVDIIVGLSFLSFVHSAESLSFQLVWVVLYVGWLVLLKPRSDSLSVTAQAFIAQAVGLAMAGRELVHLYHVDIPLLSPEFLFILAVWVICYTSARHFLTVFEDEDTDMLAALWAFGISGLAWILSHWFLLYKGYVPQLAVIASLLGYGLGAIYYLDQKERLSQRVLRQYVLFIVIGLVVIIALSDWQYHVI